MGGAAEGSGVAEVGMAEVSSQDPGGGAKWEWEEPAAGWAGARAVSAERVEGRAGVAESDPGRPPSPWAGARLQRLSEKQRARRKAQESAEPLRPAGIAVPCACPESVGT